MIIIAIASVVLSVGWHDGAWKWQLPIGIPISFVLTVLTAVAIHVFNLVPDQFPSSFYLWAWLIWYSLVIIVLGWTRAHWLLRIFSVIALVFSVVAAFTVVNQSFDYYPTLARLLGKDAANFTNLPQLKAIRTQVRETGKLPSQGSTIAVTIPGTISKFKTGQAYVYLPPAWFKNPEPQLPVIELIAGIPGEPADWTRAGYADSTSTAFANAHHGRLPHSGHPRQQRQCPGHRVLQLGTRQCGNLPGQGCPQLHAGQLQRGRRQALPRGGRAVRRRHLRQHPLPSQPTGLPDLRRLLGIRVADLPQRRRAADHRSAVRWLEENYEAHNPVALLPESSTRAWPDGSPPARATPNPWPRLSNSPHWRRRRGCRSASARPRATTRSRSGR